MSLESSIIQIKREIKTWEHNFQKQSGRPPSKSDVKENIKVLKLYKAYKTLKLKQQTGTTVPKTKPVDNFIDTIKDISGDENDEDNNEFSEERAINQNTNLGPTPQAGGKVLSIFDMKLTPPESSPLKNKSDANLQPPIEGEVGQIEFKTPTKPKIINQATPSRTNPKGNTFMQKMATITALQSPVRTPNKSNPPPLIMLLETPNYLKKNILKFDFNENNFQQKKSPFLTHMESSPVKQSTTNSGPSTPSRLPQSNFQVSPSPLKSQGFLGLNSNRRLLDVFQDHKNISITDEELNEYHVEESEDEPDSHTGALPSKKRSKTQKRTTRRWKMRPNHQTHEDELKHKDIHKVMEKINEAEASKLEKMANGELDHEEEQSDNDNEPVRPNNPQSSSKRKIAPVSRNYKRLKINHKGKGKFRRRR